MMDEKEFHSLVKEIVKQAMILKNKHTSEKHAPVNYACIFSQNKKENELFIKCAKKMGTIIKETPTGPLFHIRPLQTTAGKLQLLKIRLPDKTRPEQGDADFTVADYSSFKKKYLKKKEFSLIKREYMEMMELVENGSSVRVYFSHPPLDEQLKLKNQEAYWNNATSSRASAVE